MERRASDESPEPGKESSVSPAKPARRQAAATKAHKTRRQSPQAHSTPQHQHHDEYLLMPLHDVRAGSHTPPLYSPFTAYTPPSDASMPSYGHMQPFIPVTTLEPCQGFLPTTTATTPPPMSRLTDEGKGVFYTQEDPFSSSLGYGWSVSQHIPGINVDASHPFDAAGSNVSAAGWFAHLTSLPCFILTIRGSRPHHCHSLSIIRPTVPRRGANIPRHLSPCRPRHLLHPITERIESTQPVCSCAFLCF